MKVILNSDIEGRGEVGDIVEVKPGYARNFLFPMQMAYPVTPHNLNMMKARKKKLEQKLEIERLSAQEQVKKLEELTLTFEKKAGENDVLFGSVTTSDIEKKLSELGVTVERKKIHLEEQIKRLGNYSCKIKLMKDVEAELKIVVIGEEGPEPDKKADSAESEPETLKEKPVEKIEPETLEEERAKQVEPEVAKPKKPGKKTRGKPEATEAEQEVTGGAESQSDEKSNGAVPEEGKEEEEPQSD